MFVWGTALVARVAFKPPILADVRRYFPWSAFAILAGLVLAAALLWAVVRWPSLRHTVAVLAAVAIAAAWIRSRPAYGRRRGWPPGSLGIAESFDAIGDRDYYRDRAHRLGPVFKTSQFGRPVVCVYGLSLARDALRNSDALVGASLPYNRFLPEGSLRYMGSRVHDETAPFFRAALSRVSLARHERVARMACRRMLAEVASKSPKGPDGAAVREDLREWVFSVLSSIFWGLGPGDPRLPELRRAYTKLRLGRGGGPRWRRELKESLARVEDLMRERAREADLGATDAAVSCALAAALAADPDALDTPARAHNLTLMFRLGTADLTSLLDWIVAMLGDHPEWQDRVRGEPLSSVGNQPPDRDTVAGRFVHETIRLEQSEYLYREVSQPITIGGYRIPRGWLLRVLVQESHRDPSIFPDPDRFDPDRFAGAERSRREYSPFGVDDHGCMGVPMVHFAARILVEEICHGYELVLVRGAPPEKGTRHRDHWRPGSGRRIRLVPREAGGGAA